MSKPKTLNPLTRARRALIRAGATPGQVNDFELLVLEQVVLKHLSLGGEITQPTWNRIHELRGEDPS